MSTERTRAARQFDPVSLQIMWSRLVAAVDESAATLVRTSFSTLVRESNDFSCVITDAKGNSLAQSTASIPSFIGTLPATVKSLLEEFPPETMRPGDVLITNDMYIGTGHLPDINVVRPVFKDGQLVAVAASVAHAPDIGGKLRAPDPREVFEEGLQIPMMKLAEEGRLNQDLLKIVRANTRVPDQVVGDLMAQIAATEMAERRLGELMQEYGLDDLVDLAATIQDYSEAAMRNAIRALPDGEYISELNTDGLAEPVVIKCKIVVKGDELLVDYTGSSAQVDRALNVVPHYGYAYTVYGVKCALAPSVPNNEGCFKPVGFYAPEGSILNPRPPAAGGARVLVGHYLTFAVMEALAGPVPDRVLAASGAPVWALNMLGTNRNGTRFANCFFFNGGMGARPTLDGIHTMAFPGNTGNTPIELMESWAPILIEKKEIRANSGGPGKYRGGCGQTAVIRNMGTTPLTVSFLAERTNTPAPGIFGGLAGGFGSVKLDGVPINSKETRQMVPGERLELCTPGGGGYGNPVERNRSMLERDIEYGRVSREQARDLYEGKEAVQE
jgi:N-methylhydantoinase B